MSNELILFENAKRAVALLMHEDEVARHIEKARLAEEYARRAKDATLETQAAEYRSYCSRRYAELVKGVKAKAGRPAKNLSSTGEISKAGLARSTGIPQTTARRMEPLADIPEPEFEAAVETLKAQGTPPTPQRVMAVHHSTKSEANPGGDQWNTPDDILERVMAVMGDIDLDPCSDPGKNVPAKAHFTQADDGLSKEWGGRVFMNPPYSENLKWVTKLKEECGAGRVTQAIVLVPSRTDTKWFREMRALPVCFLRGRLTFKGAQMPAPFPSAVFYYGSKADDRTCNFWALFHGLGDIYVMMGCDPGVVSYIGAQA